MRLTILYDAECPFCLRSAQQAGRWSQDFELLGVQDDERRRRFPQVDENAALESMHVVSENGEIYRGAQAWARLAERGPWVYRVMAASFRLPGVPWMAERIYGAIAKRRRRIARQTCSTGACAVPPGERSKLESQSS